MTNIAIVVLDTLRKDSFDTHFDWLSGIRFETAYSTANWTVPAHASLFTGRYPSEVGVHAKNTTFDYPGPALAERLSTAGYRTRGFSANMHITGPLDFDRGFDRLIVPGAIRHLDDDSIFDWQAFGERTDETGLNRYAQGVKECLTSDVDTFRSLLAGIRFKLESDDPTSGTKYGGANEALEAISEMEFDENEFLFLNLMEAHEPYQAPEEYQSVPEPELTDAVGDITYGTGNDGDVAQAYDDCVRYLSDRYREVYDTLSQSFDYIITVSDHGELLGESGMWGHEYGVHPQLVRIPLVVSGPDVNTETRTRPVSIIDIYDTVLSLAGIESDRSHGHSLLADGRDRDLLTEYLGLSPWSERALRDSGYEEVLEEYDRTLRGITLDGEYFYETQDGLVGTASEATEEAKAQLCDTIDALEERGTDGQRDVPEEIKDQLAALGYA